MNTTTQLPAAYWVSMAAPELLTALQAEHQAIDWLMARLITLDPTFKPTESPIWPAVVAGKEAMDKAKGPNA